MTLPLLLLLQACTGCSACTPAPPDLSDDTGDDTGDTGDATTAPTTDTGVAAPPCPFPEVEPNDSDDQANAIPLETRVCGGFSELADYDFFAFRVDAPDWIKIDVDAVAIASLADVMAWVTSGQEHSLLSARDEESTDPYLVFYVDEPSDWYVALYEQYGGAGKHYDYELMVSVTKPPVEWDAEEHEPNDTLEQAEPLSPGVRTMGTIEASTDFDFYRYTPGAGDTEVTFALTAATAGSPLNAMFVLYDEQGNELITKRFGETIYDRDPLLVWPLEGPDPLVLLVMNESSPGGDPAAWYVLEATPG